MRPARRARALCLALLLALPPALSVGVCCVGAGGPNCTTLPINLLPPSSSALAATLSALNYFGGAGADAYFALPLPPNVVSVTVDTCHPRTSFDTQLSFYTGLQGASDGSLLAASPLLVSSNDDYTRQGGASGCAAIAPGGDPQRSSSLTLKYPQGATLFVVVDSPFAQAPGAAFGLNVQVVLGKLPGRSASPVPQAPPPTAPLPGGRPCPSLPPLLPWGATASPSQTTRTPTPSAPRTPSPSPSPTPSVTPTAAPTPSPSPSPSPSPLPPTAVQWDYAAWAPIAALAGDVCVLSQEGAVVCYASRPALNYTASSFVALSASLASPNVLFARREDGSYAACALVAGRAPACSDALQAAGDTRASLANIPNASAPGAFSALAQGAQCTWALLREGGNVSAGGAGGAGGACAAGAHVAAARQQRPGAGRALRHARQRARRRGVGHVGQRRARVARAQVQARGRAAAAAAGAAQRAARVAAVLAQRKEDPGLAERGRDGHKAAGSVV